MSIVGIEGMLLPAGAVAEFASEVGGLIGLMSLVLRLMRGWLILWLLISCGLVWL